MKRELYYTAALGAGELTFQAAQEKILAQWPDATLVFLAPELDDGRLMYDGEVHSGSTRITFELGASTMDFRDYKETAIMGNSGSPMVTAEPTSAALSATPMPTSAVTSTGQ